MNKLIATGILLLVGLPELATADDTARASIGDTHMVAGGDVLLDEPIDGSAFAAGGRVEVQAQIDRSAYLSGGEVTIAGSIGRNLYAAGGTIRMSSEASVDGKASFAGGSIEIDGAIGGNLRAFGETIVINGSVGGDVEAAGESIRIGPDARIAGRVAYRSRDEIVVDPAAQVTGGLSEARKDREWLRRLGRGATIVGGITVSLGMVLLGAVLILGMPRFSREAAGTIRRKPWQSAGLGFVMLVGVPIAIVILMITLVGIPLALLLVFCYGALLLLGFLIAAIFVGDTVLERIDGKKMDSVWWRALFLLLALLAIAIVRQVPIIGDLAWWLLFLAGLGAFTMRTWQGFKTDTATV